MKYVSAFLGRKVGFRETGNFNYLQEDRKPLWFHINMLDKNTFLTICTNNWKLGFKSMPCFQPSGNRRQLAPILSSYSPSYPPSTCSSRETYSGQSFGPVDYGLEITCVTGKFYVYIVKIFLRTECC